MIRKEIRETTALELVLRMDVLLTIAEHSIVEDEGVNMKELIELALIDVELRSRLKNLLKFKAPKIVELLQKGPPIDLG